MNRPGSCPLSSSKRSRSLPNCASITWPLVLFLILTLCPVVTRAGEEEKKPDFTEALRLIDVWIDAQRDYDQLPGLSVGIVQDQVLVWSKGYGLADQENKVPARPDTIYSICSISKLFTAVAIMQLRDAGKLRLDDRIQDLLPYYNLKQEFADSGPITVRSLLTHSSGLPRESDYPYWTGPDFPFPDREAIRNKLGEQKTLYPAATYLQVQQPRTGLARRDCRRTVRPALRTVCRGTHSQAAALG